MTNKIPKIPLIIGDTTLCLTCNKPKKIISFEFAGSEDDRYIKFECGHSLCVRRELVKDIWEGMNPTLIELTALMRYFVKNRHPDWRMAEGSFKSNKQYYKWKIEKL